MTSHPQPKQALSIFGMQQTDKKWDAGLERLCLEALERVAPSTDTWGSTGFKSMADNHGKILSCDTETWSSLLNLESFLKHQCHVSEGCIALQLCAKKTWKLGCPCVSARTHSYGISALRFFFFPLQDHVCNLKHVSGYVFLIYQLFN